MSEKDTKSPPRWKHTLEHTPKGLVLFVGLEGATRQQGFPVEYADIVALREQAERLLRAA